MGSDSLLESNKKLKIRNRKLSRRNKMLRDMIHEILDTPMMTEDKKDQILEFIQGDEQYYYDDKDELLQIMKSQAIRRLAKR